MKITIVRGDDWLGIYRDRRLVYEAHSISPGELLRVVGIAHETKYADEKWLNDEGNLPNSLDLVRFEK